MSALPCESRQGHRRTHPETSVRAARLHEHGAIVALLQDANREFREVLPVRVFYAYMQNLRDLVADEAVRELMLAELNGHILGAVAFHPDASRQSWNLPKGWAGIRALAVDPTARGRGIGRQLAEACVLRAWRIGATVACLHTSPVHRTARRLYDGMGFVRSPEHDFDVGDIAQDRSAAIGSPADSAANSAANSAGDLRGERLTIEAFRLDLRA